MKTLLKKIITITVGRNGTRQAGEKSQLHDVCASRHPPFRSRAQRAFSAAGMVALFICSVTAFADSWNPAAPMGTPRAGHTATLLNNGEVLVVGGWSGSSNLTSAERYRPDANSWVASGQLTVGRNGHTATKLANGTVIIAGGRKWFSNINNGSLADMNSVEIYDPITGWSNGPAMTHARGGHTGTLLGNGKLLVTGGLHYDSATNTFNCLPNAELYDPATGRWTSTDSMSIGRLEHTATLLRDGTVLVAGGFNCGGPPDSPWGTVQNTTEIFNPTTGTWTRGPNLNKARSAHNAALLQNGEVLVFGGSSDADNGDILMSEYFDPVRQGWYTTGQSMVDRAWFSATSLNNGRILAQGGDYQDQSAETFDPNTLSWSYAATPVYVATYNHTSTLLNSGQVLVAGGDQEGDGSDVKSSAQIYTPDFPVVGQAATLVLGQPDFTSGTSGSGATNLNNPMDVAVDPATGKVFVADSSNNRVLRFPSGVALSNGAAAEAVVGQPDFSTTSSGTTAAKLDYPGGLFVDAGGRLWVSDGGNDRVLRFDNASMKSSGANADGVLGQADFTTGGAATAQNRMHLPRGVFVDEAGRLWVSDRGNNRVLRFDNAAAKPNGANADGVLGQVDYVSGSAATTRNRMDSPSGVTLTSTGALFVVDSSSMRVLRFDNAAAKANGADADGVLGQPDFTNILTATTRNGMNLPIGVGYDNSGRLYVADAANSRVLVFNNAATLGNGANADSVLGQPDFTTGSSNTGGRSARTLSLPVKAFRDNSAGVLWVADSANNRVLGYGYSPSSCTDPGGLWLVPSNCVPTPGVTVKIMNGVLGDVYVPGRTLMSTFALNEVWGVRYRFGGGGGYYSIQFSESMIPGELIARYDVALSRIPGDFSNTIDHLGNVAMIPSVCKQSLKASGSIRLVRRELATIADCPLDAGETYYWNIRVSATTPAQSCGNGPARASSCIVRVGSSIPPYWLSLTSDGHGAVAGSGGYAAGSTVNLSATPDAGYRLAGWSPAPCAASFPMPASDLTCSGSFALNTYTVTATAGAGGTINPTSATVNHGATSSFTVTPNAGYQIASVTGCSGTLSGNTYTTDPVTANCTVTAAFATVGNCGAGPVIVTQPFTGGTSQVRSESTLATSGPVTIAANATVTFEAKTSIRLTPGFSAKSGATFTARIAPVSCASARAAPASASEVPPEAKLADDAAPGSRLLAWEEIPSSLARLLGVAAAEVEIFSADQSGNRIVFATDKLLAAADGNGHSDVYLYEADAEPLTVLSLAATGRTGNGDSLEPRIDGSGRFVAFSSDASDLTADDLNGHSDIFVLDLESNRFDRVSRFADESPSRRPDIAADGAAVVFEQAGEGESSVALFDGASGEVLAVEDELGAVERHHPAISADGRFLAYLASEGDSCAIRFVDRQGEVLGQADCPDGLAGREDAVPLFDEGGDWLLWRIPGAEGLDVANPLAR